MNDTARARKLLDLICMLVETAEEEGRRYRRWSFFSVINEQLLWAENKLATTDDPLQVMAVAHEIKAWRRVYDIIERSRKKATLGERGGHTEHEANRVKKWIRKHGLDQLSEEMARLVAERPALPEVAGVAEDPTE